MGPAAAERENRSAVGVHSEEAARESKLARLADASMEDPGGDLRNACTSVLRGWH